MVSEILAFGIWNIAQGIQNPTNDWNWKPVPGIRNPLSGIQNPRLLDSLTRGELANITSCVEDAGFFRGKGKFSRTRARPREEKGLLFLFVCFPLHELHNKLTQLTSACHVLYEIEFYMNQTNFEFCQLLLFFYYSLKIFIYSFFYLRTSEGHGCSCKGWLSTLQEGGGGMGRLWWGMNGIHQNRPFFKMASRQNFLLFSGWIAVHYFSEPFGQTFGSARVSFFFCLKEENSNTRKMRNKFIFRAPGENRTHDPPSFSCLFLCLFVFINIITFKLLLLLLPEARETRKWPID